MKFSNGARVKLLRKQNKMTQVEFSTLLGISQGRLSEIEKDITKPSAAINCFTEKIRSRFK